MPAERRKACLDENQITYVLIGHSPVSAGNFSNHGLKALVSAEVECRSGHFSRRSS